MREKGERAAVLLSRICHRGASSLLLSILPGRRALELGAVSAEQFLRKRIAELS